SIQVEYSAIDYHAPEQVRYQFRLDGSWSEPAENASVQFANPAPGRYRFQVRAVNSAPASFTFTIAPPLWRRWWFQTAAGLLIGLAALAAHRFRVAHVIALERLRTRLATDLHDDI